jgi:putative oxidoreductase
MLFSGAPVQFPPLFGLSATLSFSLAVFAKVLCSLFVIAGFATRLAVLPLIRFQQKSWRRFICYCM